MSLLLLLVLVLFGVSLVVGAVYLAGGSRKFSFADAGEVKPRFLLDYPDFDSKEIVISDDNNVAILFGDAPNMAGLVLAMGTHSITRMLDADLLISIVRSDKGLVLGLRDMTLPKVEFVLSNGEQLDDIERKLKATLQNGRS